MTCPPSASRAIPRRCCGTHTHTHTHTPGKAGLQKRGHLQEHRRRVDAAAHPPRRVLGGASRRLSRGRPTVSARTCRGRMARRAIERPHSAGDGSAPADPGRCRRRRRLFHEVPPFRGHAAQPPPRATARTQCLESRTHRDRLHYSGGRRNRGSGQPAVHRQYAICVRASKPKQL